MRRMNRHLTSHRSGFAVAIFLGGFLNSGAEAAKLPLSKTLDGDEARCLNQLFPLSSYYRAPLEEQRQLAEVAKVGRADLGGNGRKDYFYLFDDIGWCGSGGCLLMIGERRKDGACHLLYEGAGDNITILRPRDNGYHRVYAPCELRFDGREYQQIHPDCPTLDIQH
jgi:hypothetical protein